MSTQTVYWTKARSGFSRRRLRSASRTGSRTIRTRLDGFDVLLNGDRITDTHNNNYSNFDDPAVNARDHLKKQSGLSASINNG